MSKNQVSKRMSAAAEKQSLLEAETKAKEDKDKEEEKARIQSHLELIEFQTMPRINLQLKSAFGLNDNLKVNEAQIGTTFQFLRTPGNAVSGKPSDDVKLLYSVGRQMAIRDTATNQVQMVPNENRSYQITALASHFSGDYSRIAMAEQDFADPSQLFFSIYEVGESGEIRIMAKRIKIELPAEENLMSPQPVQEDSKSRRGCEHHGRGVQEFTSAAAANSTPFQGTKKDNASAPSLAERSHKNLSFVSQICFSNNFQYVACLISGPINRVAVYETKAGLIKCVASENFEILAYEEQGSPMAGDQSRVSAKSKTSVRTFFQQAVTQISFNPLNYLTVVMTGPNCRLNVCKIERTDLVEQIDQNIVQMKRNIGDYANITAHAWSSDGDFFGICTEDGQICIYKMGHHIIFCDRPVRPGPSPEESYQIMSCLVNIQITEHGFIVASQEGQFIFYEFDEENNENLRQIRHWQYENEEMEEEEQSQVIRGFQALDSEQKMMAVQLSNRNVLLIDLWSEVYNPEKREDIAMKLQEHDNIVNSDEEKIRMKKIKAQDKKKAEEARVKEREQISSIDFTLVGNGAHAGEITEMHTCLQRPIILTMSQADQTIRLWNYADNTCELEQNFAIGLGEQKPLISCALHPSGYYMAVALADHIRLYHILHPDLKQFNQYDQKNTKRIKFSSGGQYFCAIDHKNVHIFSTYSLERVRNLQIPPNSISTISFNFNDSKICFVSVDGLMQSFCLEEFNRIGELRNDRSFSYKNSLYLSHNDMKDNQLVVVGTEKDECASLKIFQGDELKECLNFKDNFVDPSGNSEVLCFNDIIKVVSSESLLENLVIGTNRGSLIVHGMPPRFLKEDTAFKYGETLAHLGQVNSLQASACGKYVFSAGEDGIIFMYEVQEYYPDKNRRGNTIAKQESSQPGMIDTSEPEEKKNSIASNAEKSITQDDQTPNSPSGAGQLAKNASAKGIEIQDELARIVLVGKGLMEDWRKMQETLRTEMEKQQDIVDSSLRAENFSFIQRNNEMEKDKTKKLNELNRDYEVLQMEEAEQKDENQQQMNKLEINHNQCKEELQDLYEKKLEHEMDMLKKLKEAQNEMKCRFELEIKELNANHDHDVEELLEDFKGKLQDVQGLYEDSKKVADDLKMKNEEKLTSQEQDQLFEITELNNEHKEVIDKHTKQISELKNNIERQKYHKKKIETEISELQHKIYAINHVKKEQKQTKEDCENKKKELDIEKAGATQNLKTKEAELFQQKFKIKDLQKKKQVLTHRTFEMKASLEPKEQQIESLKTNLHDLEKLFHMQNKSLKQMEVNVEAKKDCIVNLERKRKQAKVNTKKKEHDIQDFVQDIQKTMQKQDDGEKLQGFMAIYRQHVKTKSAELMTKKQKDPELIDQLDKHLKFREKEIRQLQENSSKTVKKAKDHLANRTKENKRLIVLLEELRQKDKDRKKDQGIVDKQITKFFLDKRRIDTEIEKMKEEMQKMKIQEATKPGFHKASSVYTKPKEGDDRVADQFKRNQSRGKLIKGSLYNTRPAGMYKQQISELNLDLSKANETIVAQNLQISRLRDEYEAQRQALIDCVPNAQNSANEMQRQQNPQLTGELQNLQLLGDEQHQQFMSSPMVGLNGQMQEEIDPTMTQVVEHQQLNQHTEDSERKDQSRQDMDGQPAMDDHYHQ